MVWVFWEGWCEGWRVFFCFLNSAPLIFHWEISHFVESLPHIEVCCRDFFAFLCGFFIVYKRSFCFSVGLQISLGVLCWGKFKICSKVTELDAGKLGPVFWHDYVEDAMGSKDTFQFGNQGCYWFCCQGNVLYLSEKYNPLLGSVFCCEIQIDPWLVGWVLWHINFCRLFNTKSIFMQLVSSISSNSV